MTKRTSIKGMGADAWFTPEERPQEVNPTTKLESQQDSKPAKQRLVKATFYLTPENITSLEELKLRELKETGERVDKSELVRRAIDLLVEQHNSKPVRQ